MNLLVEIGTLDIEMMSHTFLTHTREQVNAAGKLLRTLDQNDPARVEAVRIANEWRNCHTLPLMRVSRLLEQAATVVNKKAVVVSRLKRLPSILLKLKHNASMRLTQMQDIGGCRAILDSVDEVADLGKRYRHGLETIGESLVKSTTDLIAEPRADGYRGVHHLVEFHGDPHLEKRVGSLIEVQMRTALQHSWATAVETCQTFTGQSLKPKIKDAEAAWLRFFSLMSSEIAVIEGKPIVPHTPTNAQERKEEIRGAVIEKDVVALLRGWQAALKHHESFGLLSAFAYLLELNARDGTLQMKAFNNSELSAADSLYHERESATQNDPSIQVVLVSADSIGMLKRGFPNYYADTSAFIDLITQTLS